MGLFQQCLSFMDKSYKVFSPQVARLMPVMSWCLLTKVFALWSSLSAATEESLAADAIYIIWVAIEFFFLRVISVSGIMPFFYTKNISSSYS